MNLNNLTDLQNLFATAPTGVAIINATTLQIEMVNDAFLEVTGRLYTNTFGKHIWDVFAETALVYAPKMEEAIKSGESIRGEEVEIMLIRHGNEENLFISFVYMPLFDEKGSVNKVAVWVIENTSKAQERQTIQRLNKELTATSEALLATQLAVDAAHIGAWNIQPETMELKYSPAVAEIFGYEGKDAMTYEQVIGQVSPEYQTRIVQEIDQAIRSGGNYDIIYSQRRFSDNGLIWIRSFGKVMQDKWEKYSLFSGVVLDITQQITTRLQIENLNEEMAAMNEELALTNAELAAMNEEMAVTNEELNEANLDLANSNDALVQARNTLELANNKLAESELNLQLTVQAADLALWTIFLDTQTLFLSAQYRAMFGFPMDGEISIEQVISRVEPDDLPIAKNTVSDAITSGKNINVQYRIRNRITGKLKHIKSVGKVITNRWGTPVRLIGANIDITQEAEAYEKELQLNAELEFTNEQMAAINEEMAATNEELMSTNDELIVTQHLLEQSLSDIEESRFQFRGMIHASPIGMALLRGGDMIFEEVNEAFLQIIGKHDFVVGRPLLGVLPELAGQPVLEFMYNTYRTGQEARLTEILLSINKNEEIHQGYYNINYTAYVENGEIAGIMVSGIEVTEQVLARRKVEQAEQSLRLAIDGAQMGTYFFNLQTGEMISTPRAKELFGFGVDDKINFDRLIVQIREDYRKIIMEAFQHAIATGSLFEQDYPIVGYHNGKLRWIRGVGKVQQNNSGQRIYSGISIDITEQKIDEQRKSDFISMVSHELKTPLTSLKAYVQVLQKKAQQSEDGFMLTTLTRANSSIQKMTLMINGFLNVSRLESGKIQLEMADFDMMALVVEVEQDASITVSSHRFVFHPVSTNLVRADREKIGQVISNLISNAVKYSPAGSTISVACMAKENNVEVSIKDEGMGIAEKDLDKVFDRYYRAQNLQMSNISGFGIGLYLCAQIIERHGGQIGAKSEIGKGSTFYFTLPLA